MADPMRSKINIIKIISYGLIVLYASSFWIYWQAQSIPGFQTHAVLLMALSAALLFGAMGVSTLSEWGRLILVFGNVALAIYLLKLYVDFSDLIQMSYVFMAIVLVLFFNQSSTKARFQSRGKNQWQSILVIDDDELLIKTVRPVLINSGYSVLTANTGEMGIQVAQRQKPDLIILDVILPGMKGRDVCKRLKNEKSTQNIPIIFLTAKYSQDDIQAEMAAGAEAHLTKPVNPKTLVSTIQHILNS